MKKLIILVIVLFTNNTIAYDNLRASMKLSAHAMDIQGKRLKIISQNIANRNSLGRTPGADPYMREAVELRSKYDRNLGGKRVIIAKYLKDRSKFIIKYDPAHPAANKDGYVKMPNVDINIENADSKDALRAYEANLGLIDVSKSMYLKTVEMLK